MNKSIAGTMIDYECGRLGRNETIELFASLVKNGMAWTLQGSYGRTASALIDMGFVSEDGEVISY